MDKQEIIGILALVLLALPLVLGVQALPRRMRRREKAMDKNDFTVRQSVWMLLTGVLITGASLLILGLALWVSVRDGQWDTLLLAGAAIVLFFLLGLVVLIQALRWKLEVKWDTFTVTNLWGKQKTYSFSQITKVAWVTYVPSQIKKVIVYAGKRKLFEVDYFQAGYGLLRERLQKQDVSHQENTRGDGI